MRRSLPSVARRSPILQFLGLSAALRRAVASPRSPIKRPEEQLRTLVRPLVALGIRATDDVTNLASKHRQNKPCELDDLLMGGGAQVLLLHQFDIGSAALVLQLEVSRARGTEQAVEDLTVRLRDPQRQRTCVVMTTLSPGLNIGVSHRLYGPYTGNQRLTARYGHRLESGWGAGAMTARHGIPVE